MAENKLYGAQKAVNTCTDHEQEEVEMYCRTCGKAICTKCVKGDHKEHDWETLIKVAKELRKKTSHEKLKVESVSKSIIIGITDMLDFLESEADTELATNSSQLDSRRKSIVEYVNERFDEMNSKCKNKHKGKLDRIQEQKTLLDLKTKRINFLIENMETGANEFTDSDLIELYDEIHGLLYELQDLAAPPYNVHDRMIYKSGSSDWEILESLIGTVEEDILSPEVMLDREIKIGDTIIITIYLLSETEAWIHPAQTKMNQLVDSSGSIKKSVNLDCDIYNFTVSNDDCIYFCDGVTNTVMEFDQQGNKTSLFSTSPLIPLMINLTRSGDFPLTLVDKRSYDRNMSSRRLVRRTTTTGRTIMEYEFQNDGKTPLFCRPIRPIEHQNGNICVINRTENEAVDPVYCFDCRGKILFKYDGNRDVFDPIDICCDKDGNILVSDSSNRLIHIINAKGLFLLYLLTAESFTEDIYAMSIFGRILWIGSFDTGIIKLFKLEYK